MKPWFCVCVIRLGERLCYISIKLKISEVIHKLVIKTKCFLFGLQSTVITVNTVNELRHLIQWDLWDLETLGP